MPSNKCEKPGTTNKMKRNETMRDEMSKKRSKNSDQETTQFFSLSDRYLNDMYIYTHTHEIEAATCEIGNVFYTLANF